MEDLVQMAYRRNFQKNTIPRSLSISNLKLRFGCVLTAKISARSNVVRFIRQFYQNRMTLRFVVKRWLKDIHIWLKNFTSISAIVFHFPLGSLLSQLTECQISALIPTGISYQISRTRTRTLHRLPVPLPLLFLSSTMPLMRTLTLDFRPMTSSFFWGVEFKAGVSVQPCTFWMLTISSTKKRGKVHGNVAMPCGLVALKVFLPLVCSACRSRFSNE